MSEFTLQSTETERVWDVDGVAVLSARAVMPKPVGTERRRRRIASFYRVQERAFFQYCQRELRPWAEAEYRAAAKNSVPHAALNFQETYRAGRLWSLYTELRENAAPG
ncbi:MAG: hypothetical protein IJR48_09810, partial [Oscillibacter sp.]|nr:hypothetical protein [Oscillibacter sp.]